MGIEPATHRATSSPPAGAPEGGLRRLMQVTVAAATLMSFLRKVRGSWAYEVPRDARVAGCQVDPSRKAVRLVVESATFPELALG
jgi:hypothetical protein